MSGLFLSDESSMAGVAFAVLPVEEIGVDDDSDVTMPRLLLLGFAGT
jgi:hypothetical protein